MLRFEISRLNNAYGIISYESIIIIFVSSSSLSISFDFVKVPFSILVKGGGGFRRTDETLTDDDESSKHIMNMQRNIQDDKDQRTFAATCTFKKQN